MALERTIITQIKTQIQANADGSGSYSNDLSGADSVAIGEQFSPARIPGVYLFIQNIGTAQSAGATRLDSYSRTMTVQLEGWTAADSDVPGQAALVALDLYHDLTMALEADRTLGGNVRDIEISGTTFDGWEIDKPGLGLAVLSMSITFRQTAGL